MKEKKRFFTAVLLALLTFGAYLPANPAKLFQLYYGLKNGTNIAIEVVRNGQHQTNREL